MFTVYTFSSSSPISCKRIFWSASSSCTLLRGCSKPTLAKLLLCNTTPVGNPDQCPKRYRTHGRCCGSYTYSSNRECSSVRASALVKTLTSKRVSLGLRCVIKASTQWSGKCLQDCRGCQYAIFLCPTSLRRIYVWGRHLQHGVGKHAGVYYTSLSK